MSPEKTSKTAQSNTRVDFGLIESPNGLGKDTHLLNGMDVTDIEDDLDQDSTPGELRQFWNGLGRLNVALNSKRVSHQPGDQEDQLRARTLKEDIRDGWLGLAERFTAWWNEDLSTTAQITKILQEQQDPQPSLKNRPALFEGLTIEPLDKAPAKEPRKITLFEVCAVVGLVGTIAILYFLPNPIKTAVSHWGEIPVPVRAYIDNPDTPELETHVLADSVLFEVVQEKGPRTDTNPYTTRGGEATAWVSSQADRVIVKTPFLGKILTPSGEQFTYSGLVTLRKGPDGTYVSDPNNEEHLEDPISEVYIGVAPVLDSTVGSIIKTR